MIADLLGFFAELPARFPALRLDLLGRLVVASLCGGAIGWERSWSGKPAGLRTNLLICVGATLLTYVGISMAREWGSPGDPARLSAQIVSGIGFLGAGTIIQSRGTVTGLTSAATLWVVGAIGIATGSGYFVEALGTTALVLGALVPLQWLETRAERHWEAKRLGAEASDLPG